MGRRRGSQRHADSSLCARLPAAQVTTAGGAAVITMENKTVDAPVQRTDGAQAWLGGGSNARGGACSGAPGAACAVCTCPAGAVDVPLPAPRWLGPCPTAGRPAGHPSPAAGSVWNVTKPYVSGFFDSWNKFCFTGGYLEAVSVRGRVAGGRGSKRQGRCGPVALQRLSVAARPTATPWR